jgi:hypothetical protein
MRTARLRAAVVTVATLGAATLAFPAAADTAAAGGFEGYSLGDPLGQFGWTALDIPVYNASHFDEAIVDPSPTWGTALGSRALRISNGVTSGGFGNQLQTPSLVNEAGEASAEDAPNSGGTRQQRFEGTLTFASAVPGAQQPGLVVSFAPDSGDGTRMSQFRIYDLPAGLEVVVVAYDRANPAFNEIVLASSLDRTQVHTMHFTMDFVDGVDNDVLTADFGTCTSTTVGTWEDYHRDNFPDNPTKPVDSLLFRQAGAAVPANLGGGILFDNIVLSSGPTPPPPAAPGPPTPPAGVAVSGDGATAVVAAAPSTAAACAPVTTYTLTATPVGGGAPIILTGASPTFSLASLPPGYLYELVLAAWNEHGASLPSDPIIYSTITLAESGIAAGGQLLIAVGLVAAGSGLLVAAQRRRAHR